MAAQAKVQTMPAHDYLAVILIGGGSSWGRSPDKEDAIKRAIIALKDWTVHYQLSNVEVTINVIDVQGYSKCHWGAGYPDGCIQGTNETTGQNESIQRPIEQVQRQTPNWRVKR